MSRKILLQEITKIILNIQQPYPVRVGIDGIDAAGKTYLADELADHLKESGRGIIRASIDGFHHPREIRSRRGDLSPQGYYDDSFDYEAVIKHLLKPLGPQGSRFYRQAIFDFMTNSKIFTEKPKAADTDILIFDGVFLFRPELIQYWDFKIFVDIEFSTCLTRALNRDAYLFGEETEIKKRYQAKYIPGQQIYLGSVNPKLKADIVIDNNKFDNAKMIKYSQ